MQLIKDILLPKHPIVFVSKEIDSHRHSGNKLSVLDLGFGEGAHWKTAPPRTTASILLTAVDAYDAPTQSDSQVPRPTTKLLGKVPEILNGIEDSAFDFVLAFDLIEHLSKEDGYLLSYHMQRICSKAAFIFTPNGHVWQPPSQENSFQAHISGWRPTEFKGLGWQTLKGCRGAKFFYGPFAAPKIFPHSKLLAAVRAPIDRLFVMLPRLSFSFLAIFRRDR